MPITIGFKPTTITHTSLKQRVLVKSKVAKLVNKGELCPDGNSKIWVETIREFGAQITYLIEDGGGEIATTEIYLGRTI